MKKDRTAPVSMAPRPSDFVHKVTRIAQPDEFLRRARLADAARQTATAADASALTPTAVRMAQLQIHTPSGELIGSYDLPEQIADTIIVAIRHAGRAIADDNAEHSRTADTVPARPALSVLTGGVA